MVNNNLCARKHVGLVEPGGCMWQRISLLFLVIDDGSIITQCVRGKQAPSGTLPGLMAFASPGGCRLNCNSMLLSCTNCVIFEIAEHRTLISNQKMSSFPTQRLPVVSANVELFQIAQSMQNVVRLL